MYSMKSFLSRPLLGAIAVSVGLMLSGTAQISLAAPQIEVPLTSKQIIENYRVLRSNCAKSLGVERRNCYSQLSVATVNYQQAKERMSQSVSTGTLLTSH
jgi:hypothetical protein